MSTTNNNLPKTSRLAGLCQEFNIGRETAMAFLIEKKLALDEAQMGKSDPKLSEDQVKALHLEFQKDKQEKKRADQVEISHNENKKIKKEDTVITFTKTGESSHSETTTPTPPPVVSPTPTPVPPPNNTSEEQQTPPPPPPSEDHLTLISKPKIEGPKVLAKIDIPAPTNNSKPNHKDNKTKPVSKSKQTEKPTISKEKEIENIHNTQTSTITENTPQNEPPLMVIETPSNVEPEHPTTEIKEIKEDQTKEDQTKQERKVENIHVEKLSELKPLRTIVLPIDNKNDNSYNKQKNANGQNGKNFKPKSPGEPDIKPGENKPSQPASSTTNNSNNNFKRNRIPVKPGMGNKNRFANNTNPNFKNNASKPGTYDPKNPRNQVKKYAPSSAHKNQIEKEIDAKTIQDKIRETQAKLAILSGRGKGLKGKTKKHKKEEIAENEAAENAVNILQVTEFVTVSEMANLMNVSFAEVIAKCMNLGIMATINQRLDAEVIELVAHEFNFQVQFVSLEETEQEEAEQENIEYVKVTRPPIVTIMGHVDHGKTSLLDYIRSANVVAGEAGGITQHIGAYEVTLDSGRNITFLDTPGHEAFTSMRARGAKITDIAVIVIAADDAVMPQTKEAINHAMAANVDIIIAVNKMDKDGANPDKIYEQLSQMNILVESWGGKYQNQEISAKKGLNIDLLMEKILLQADILDLKANTEGQAEGTVIEASLDKGRGNMATILVQEGTLRAGDCILSGQYFGRVKAMFNERNSRILEAGPSTPVVILGLNGTPQAGEKFKVYPDESIAKEKATKRSQLLREQGLRTKKHITLDEIGRRLALGKFKELNIIIKGDVDGSVEALSDALQKLSTPEIAVRVIHKGVGQISESDILLAAASDAIVIGFNVRASLQANKLTEKEGVEVKLYSIIYNAIEEIKSAMEGMLEPHIKEKIVANVQIRAIYKFDKVTVAGCFVLDGKIQRHSKIRIIRDGIVIFPKGENAHGELASLKRFKDDAKEVNSNMECGMTIKNYNDLKVDDIVEAYEEEEIKRTL